jgi:phage-related protein
VPCFVSVSSGHHIHIDIYSYNVRIGAPGYVRSFPREVRRDIGHALYAAQQGETDPATKTLRGFGGGTWRAVYTVRFLEAIYVLHAFQKKSKRGIATPKKDTDLIRRRLGEAEQLHRERQN